MADHKSSPNYAELQRQFKNDLKTGVGRDVKHESAELHVSGEALFVDDRPEFPDQLHLCPGLSSEAHARITQLDLSACIETEGVEIVITASDIPGERDIGAVYPGDPLLADGIVEYCGQPVFVVAATSPEIARNAVRKARIDYEPLPAIFDIKDALAQEKYVSGVRQMKRGEPTKAIAMAPHNIKGELHVGGQEHFYLETQVSSVVPMEDGGVMVFSSTQNPTEVQKLVARVLGIAMHKVIIDMRRVGGGFGGKESQASAPACLAALVTYLTGRPAKIRLNRHDDMTMTGKRHSFYIQYEVGFDSEGTALGLDMKLAANCGYSPDLSPSIMDRAMFHADNAYYLADMCVTGYCCKTNLASNTAFRGFGAPQAMLAIENIMDQIARYLEKEPLQVRKLNFYGGKGRSRTHYGQLVTDNYLLAMTEQLETDCQYHQRRQLINNFNAKSPILKKGLAITPVKFGIAFTASFLNQAGALIHIYSDGSILLNHGGVEMGQGLNTKVAQVVAEEFSVDLGRIKISAARTDKVPNTSPTAASSGSDLNGKAAQTAARSIKQRLVTFACSHFGVQPESVSFHNGIVQIGVKLFPFNQFIELAYLNQISLSSTGFYHTPELYFDWQTRQGRPFYYYTYGVACTEVVIDTLSGEHRILRADLLHDVGSSINPAIDIGQIEGAYIQGVGWLTTEELVWSDKGQLLTTSPSTYKIPTMSDMPIDFRTQTIQNHRNSENTIFNSKAVGEPPFMLAISAWSALKDALHGAAGPGSIPELDTPATPERVFWALHHAGANPYGVTPEIEDA